MKPDAFFLADPTALPELALAADAAAADRGPARPQPLPATAAETAAPRPARWLAALLARAGKSFVLALTCSRQHRALSALSDHNLRDLGLTREDFLARTELRWPRD